MSAVLGLGPSSKWLLQCLMWSADITSHLVPPLTSNLECLEAPTHKHCFPPSWRARSWKGKKANVIWKHLQISPLIHLFWDPWTSMHKSHPAPKPGSLLAAFVENTDTTEKSVPTSHNPAFFLFWFSVRESKCQAEYSAANRCKDEQNKITRISGSKLTLFCQERCE